MARGSHSVTYHPHVYPRMEWAILRAFHKHSPDVVARARWRTSESAYYSSIDPNRMKGWVGLVGWPYRGWFTHISGHPSATGRAWDIENSPVPRSQLKLQFKKCLSWQSHGCQQVYRCLLLYVVLDRWRRRCEGMSLSVKVCATAWHLPTYIVGHKNAPLCF